VTPPGISGTLGSTDQKEAIGIGNEDEGYSGPEERNVSGDGGRSICQTLVEARQSLS
jgi:hypothetical protein